MTANVGRLDSASSRYAAAVRSILAEGLGDDLVAAYVYGSALTHEFVPGRSDLDVLVVIRTWLPAHRERPLIERLRKLARPASLKGLDIWFVPLAVAHDPRRAPGYQVRLLTSMNFVVGGSHARRGDPRLAMLLAICRSHSVALVGPEPSAVIPPVEVASILGGMLADLASRAPAHYRVLNACRDRHYLDEGRMCSKLEGGAWARRLVDDPELVDLATGWHVHGAGPPIDQGRVDTFVEEVAARLRAAIALSDVPAAEVAGPSPAAAPAVTRWPAVTCVMPTYNRRRFVEQSIRLFMAQDYPNRELVIVDDGEDRIADLIPADAPVRYLPLTRRATIGYKRNAAVRHGRGEVVVQWDDDDWYGPMRLRHQLAPLVAGRAELSAIRQSWLVDLNGGRFFRRHTGPDGLVASLAAGTLAMTVDLWRRCGRYPDASKREDVTMLFRALDAGASVEAVDNEGIYVYVRHDTNSWWFEGPAGDHQGWVEALPPEFLPPGELDVYFGALSRALP